MPQSSIPFMALACLVAGMATPGMCQAGTAADPVHHDVAFLLREARSNFVSLRGAPNSDSSEKATYYALKPSAALLDLVCDSGSACAVSDHFAGNGNPEYWEGRISVAQPAWSAPDYADYRANIIRVLGPLVPGYIVQESPPYLAGGQGLFTVSLANHDEEVTINGFIGGSHSLDILVDHRAVGKKVHAYVRPKPLDDAQLHALGSAFRTYALKAIRHAPSDFSGYHPALADRRYGKGYYNIPFTSSPYIRSCEIDFDQGINKDFNLDGPAAAQGWSIDCSSKSYENTPDELAAAVASMIGPTLPAGFIRSSAKGSFVEWKDPQADIDVSVSAARNRPSDAYPHRSIVSVIIYHSDGVPH